MSYLTINNVKITGISACVPPRVEEVNKFSLFSDEDAQNFSKTTGVERRRFAEKDVCSSDLCIKAAEKLITELNWKKEDIDCLVFVTQTPDYILPATSIIIQDKLGLSDECYALDISLGCSGWVYALSVISSLMSHGTIKKGLLLVGETLSKACSPKDKSTYPLFGDAGSATAIEYSDDKKDSMSFYFNSDGSGYDVIMIEDGGYKNPVTADSLIPVTISDGIERNKLELVLEGMDVFSFGISKAPQSVKRLCEHFNIDMNTIDFYTFHQANKFMNEKIRKKLRLPEEKVLYSLKEFGNTSSVTIPLTLVTECQKELSTSNISHIVCGFGVGLSWASCYFKTNNIVCTDLIEF